MSVPDTGRNPALLSWYDSAKQPFPWRATRDPYRILISEVMSQQTQIQRVVERWSRFLERFPTVEALAAASLADVLEEWSGLGYNRRTRSLHECAKLVADTGRPDSVEGLQALPGIGPYTAGTTGAPIFDEALAWIECEVRETVTFGSHTLFIGELVDCAMNDAEAPRAAAMSDTRMKYGGVPRKAHG